MNAKYLFVFVLLILFSSNSSARLENLASTIKPGWQRVDIPGVGSVDMPPSMEVQGGKYLDLKKLALEKKFPEIQNLHKADIIIQQRGLIEGQKAAFKQFVRFIVTTFEAPPGTFRRVGDFYVYSKAELMEISEVYRAINEKQAAAISSKVIFWAEPQQVAINYAQAVHLHYKRTGVIGKKLPVLAHQYLIENNDRMHVVEIAYREDESEQWTPDVFLMLESLKITKK